MFYHLKIHYIKEKVIIRNKILYLDLVILKNKIPKINKFKIIRKKMMNKNHNKLCKLVLYYEL